MKTLQAFVYDNFPKLELGDVATRASRLHSWRVKVTQAIHPAGPHLRSWWKWVQQEAEDTYTVFLVTPLMTRESVIPTALVPEPWLQLGSWMRPKMLEVLPKYVR